MKIEQLLTLLDENERKIEYLIKEIGVDYKKILTE